MVAQNWIVGNTIVIKPPELCPISSNFYGQIFKDVGVPDGIIILFMVMVKQLVEN